MVSLQEQMADLQKSPDVPLLTLDDIINLRETSQANDTANFDAGAGVFNTLDKEVAEYSRGEAMRLAATMGVGDSVRGVSQMLGINREEMAGTQRLLNKLMTHPEWGDDVKWTWFGSLLLDPMGWLTPASKVSQLIKAGHKFTKWQKTKMLAVHGGLWGGVSGLTGYVDTDSSNRVFNAMAGVAGGAVLAPALGVPGAALGKFIASKTPEQLTEAPKKLVRELTGSAPPGLTNSVKTFYYGKFQPSVAKYEELKKKYVYKPIVLDNPIASLGAAGGAWGASVAFGPDINDYINKLEDERDMDTGPWASALKVMLMGAGAATGFGVLKKAKLKGGQTYQDYIGRRVIPNFNLSDSFVKLKQGAYLDFGESSYQFTNIAERAAALPENEKKLLYYFLDGQADSLSGLSKEAREIGSDARALIQETGQRMVDAGMLNPSTFKANMDSYIHRTYVKKMSPALLKKYGIEEQVSKEITRGPDKTRLGLIGVELKARGHLKSIRSDNKAGIARLEGLGYEKLGKPKNGMQDLRLQLTPDERKALEEIEDAAFAIKSTGDLMLNDLASYKFYSDVNRDFGYADSKELTRLLKRSKNMKISVDQRSFAAKLYKDYKKSGKKSYDQLSPEEQAAMVKLDASKLTKTGLHTYGDLAGRYIPKDIADDIMVHQKFADGESLLGKWYKWEPFQKYRRLNSIWKRTKTSWNPTVHTNNTVSNFFLLDAHDVPLDTFINHGFKVYTKGGQEALNKLDIGFGESNTYEDLVRLGVFDASLAKQELRIGQADWKTNYFKEFLRMKIKRKNRVKTDDPIEDIQDTIEMSNNFVGRNYQKYVDYLDKTKIGKGYVGKKIRGKDLLKNPVKWADKGATDLYQREDQMFRVALYIDRVEKRVPELNQFKKGTAEYDDALEKIKRSAAREATEGFIDYNIQPPLINFLRDSALPFFSYTYRVIPILAKTATLKPSKFAKWAAIGYALDYAGRERSKQETEYERAIMREKRLSRMFGLPFMPPTFIKVGDPLRGAEQFAQKRFDLALGWGLDRDPVTNEKLPQRSFYADTLRYIPGADALGQTTPEEGGFIPGLPAPFQPSGGLAGEAVLAGFGVDPFTYKRIEDPDIVNNLQFTLARLVPNNPILGFSGLQKLFGSDKRWDAFDSWSHKKIMNSLERRKDSSAYAPDLSAFNALVQTVGIKVWPFDKTKAFNVFNMKYQRELSDLRTRMHKAWVTLDKYSGTPTYDERRKAVEEDVADMQKSHERLLREIRGASSKEYHKKRERKFGEVPTDALESLGEATTDALENLSEAIFGTDN